MLFFWTFYSSNYSKKAQLFLSVMMIKNVYWAANQLSVTLKTGVMAADNADIFITCFVNDLY